MQYVSKRKLLEYADRRIRSKDVPAEAKDELKRLAKFVIATDGTRMKREEDSEVGKATMPNGQYISVLYCTECKRVISREDTYCPKCGRKLIWKQED